MTPATRSPHAASARSLRPAASHPKHPASARALPRTSAPSSHPTSSRTLVAVAGASGKVGRRLMAFLRRKRVPAVALLRSRASVSALPSGTPYCLVHFETGWGLSDALKDATHIVNLTGNVDVSAPERELYRANVVPTSHLLTAAPPPLRRFVHVSSIAVYGKHPRLPVDENSPRRPDGPYARTKLEGERQALMHASRFPVTVLQPGIIYGPGFTAGFYPLLRALQRGRATIVGSGNNRMPFIHVDDVVEGLFRALFTDAPSGSVFLLCPHESITQAKAMRSAAKLLHAPPPSRHTSPALAKLAARFYMLLCFLQRKVPTLTDELVSQMSADRYYDARRAHAILRWRPSVSFKMGLAQVISQYLDSQRR